RSLCYPAPDVVYFHHVAAFPVSLPRSLCYQPDFPPSPYPTVLVPAPSRPCIGVDTCI
ncbi:hypothetical protein BJV78DRAFT_1192425, partial [Lactifluus subvellereus]